MAKYLPPLSLLRSAYHRLCLWSPEPRFFFTLNVLPAEKTWKGKTHYLLWPPYGMMAGTSDCRELRVPGDQRFVIQKSRYCLPRYAAGEWTCRWMSARTRYTWMASPPCGCDGDAGEHWAEWTASHTGHSNKDVPLRWEERKASGWSLQPTVLNSDKLWNHAAGRPLESSSRKATLGMTQESIDRYTSIPITPGIYGLHPKRAKAESWYYIYRSSPVFHSNGI